MMFGMLRRVYRWVFPKKIDAAALCDAYLLTVLRDELNRVRVNARKKQDARSHRARAFLEGKR